MSSTSEHTSSSHTEKAPQKHKEGLPIKFLLVTAVILIVLAAAIAVPLYFFVFNAADPLTLQISFTAAGDVSDFSESQKTTVLSTLSTAAGFTAVPGAATLTVSPASAIFVATFPIADEAGMTTAKASLLQHMSDQVSAQTLLGAAVSGIIIESAPKVSSFETGSAKTEPAPFVLRGHWKTAWSARTYTDHDMISLGYSNELVKITKYTDTYYITQKPASDAYNPYKFQKHFFHTNADGSISTCTSLTDAETEEEAIGHDGVGIYDADSTACGQFTHTTMTPYTIPVAGIWVTDAESPVTLTINNEQWKSEASWGTTVRTMRAFGTSFALAQMPADDSYNPSKWVKIEWHDKTASKFEYCTSVMSANTLLDAIHYDDTKDDYHYNKTDATSGCGSFKFPHTVANSV